MELVLQVIALPKVSFKRAWAFYVEFGQHVHDHFIPHARNNYHPHILGHRALALFSALLVCVKIFTITLLAWGPIMPAFSSAITVANIISLTNESRAQSGIAVLSENQILDKAAQAKADDMLAKGYFAHNTPDGRTPWNFITDAGYNYLMAGENLAVNFTQSEDVETAWMNSPGHRANLLNKNFEDIGIGISQGEYQGHNAIFVVQEFGTPSAQQVTLSDKPTQVQTAAVPAPPAQTQSVTSKTQVRGDISKVSGVPTTNPAAIQSQTQIPTAVQPVIVPPQPITIEGGNVTLDSGNVDITANVVGPAVKVVAYFGDQAIMLSPVSDTTWKGQVAVQVLAQNSLTVHLGASGMAGQSAQLQLADFSPGTIQNYNLSGSTPTVYATIFGHTFDVKAFETNFYLLFIAGLLTCLVLAISIKRHIQHLSLIANTSFVGILACMMFMIR